MRTFAGRRAWLVALLVSAAVAALSLGSAREWTRLCATLYTYAPDVKQYRDHLEHDLAGLERAGVSLVFVDGLVPPIVDPLRGFTARHSFMLKAMGKSARFGRAGPGVYRITDSGAIVPTWRVPRR